MTEPTRPLGTDLSERYHVERERGEGGMATVYLAEDVRHARKVAIKVIRPDAAAALGTARFLSEIRLTASLQHPHILGLIDSGVVTTADGERPFYVMPYVSGETLRARLARERTLPVNDAVAILAEIADALACAHSQGIVHRDIKPENILLGQGHALVADFGIAKAVHRSLAGRSITSTGVAVGTPAYMAPEQAVGDSHVDHRADLYALGVVAYEALAGHTPFAGLDTAGMIAAALTRPAPSLSAAVPTCPASLVALVAALLERDPAKRPESAAEVRDTLRSILVALSTLAPGARPTGRTRRLAISGGAAVALLLLGFLALSRRGPGPLATPARPTSPTRAPRSIAVLPFENINGDSASEYFGDGLAEELIVELGRRLPGVRVASRTSTFAMKARNVTLADVGTRLGVDAVLESSLRRENDHIRITTKLVDVGHDSVLWAEDYNSELRGVLTVQDSFARAIVAALSGALSGASGVVSRGSRSRDLQAYQDYLRGRHFLGLRKPGAMASAIQSFSAAISRDSSFAPAYAGLAHAYSLAAPFESRAPHTVFPLARIAAERALVLDSTVAEAHTALGMVSMFYDWDWAEAGRHLKHGIDLNPSYAEGHLFYAWYLLFRGRLADADAEVADAYKLDPLSVVIATRRAVILQYQGRDAEAISFFRRALELDSAFYYARASLAVAFLRAGQRDSARRVVPRTEAHPGTAESALPIWVLAQLGDTAGARQHLRRLEDIDRRSYISADGLAAAYAVLGDTARSLDLLDRAERERAFTLAWLPRFPMYDSIRGSARYRRLVDRVGLVAP